MREMWGSDCFGSIKSMRNIDLMLFFRCAQFKYWTVSWNVISNDCSWLRVVDCTLKRYAPDKWNVIVLSQGNSTGEDCWKLVKQDVTISFKDAKLYRKAKEWMSALHYLDRWWVIVPSLDKYIYIYSLKSGCINKTERKNTVWLILVPNTLTDILLCTCPPKLCLEATHLIFWSQNIVFHKHQTKSFK